MIIPEIPDPITQTVEILLEFDKEWQVIRIPNKIQDSHIHIIHFCQEKRHPFPLAVTTLSALKLHMCCYCHSRIPDDIHSIISMIIDL
jgi:hypothetical protein